MTITFTLQSQYVSTTQAGPFNISGTTDGNVTYELATNVTKTQLTNGYSVNTAYENITGGTICSTGVCTNCVNWTVAPSPTPTPTATEAVAQFTVTPAYGINFTSITHSTALTPPFLTPITSTQSEDMISSYSDGSTFEIVAYGSRAGGNTVNINIQRNGEVVGFVDLNSDPMGNQTYYITLNATNDQGINNTDNLTISVGLGAGSLGY